MFGREAHLRMLEVTSPAELAAFGKAARAIQRALHCAGLLSRESSGAAAKMRRMVQCPTCLWLFHPKPSLGRRKGEGHQYCFYVTVHEAYVQHSTLLHILLSFFDTVRISRNDVP